MCTSLDDLDGEVKAGYNEVENLEPKWKISSSKLRCCWRKAEAVQDEYHLQQMQDVCRAFDKFLEQVQDVLSSQ